MPSSAGSGSLAGRTIVVTRARHQSREMSEALAALGAAVIELPVIAIEPVEDLSELDRALANLGSYALLVFGSKNAAEIVFSRGAKIAIPIACVGAKTKAWIEDHLPNAEIITPETFRAEALAELIASRGITGRILFPRAAEGRETLIDALPNAVDAPIVYRIVHAPPPAPEVIARLDSADAFTFLSGETLRAFLAIVPDASLRLARSQVAVIGPVAAEKAAALDVRVDLVPPAATVESLIAALAQHLT